MKLRLLAVLCAFLTVPCLAQVLYYGGDLLLDQGCQDTAPVTLALDDFVVPAGQHWHVTGVFVNALQQTLPPVPVDTRSMRVVTQATWSIRTGVGIANPGTVLYGGTSPATETPTGRMGGIYPEFNVAVSELSFDLDPGTYYLSVAPQPGCCQYLYYASFAGTANRVGTPGPDVAYVYNTTAPPIASATPTGPGPLSMGVVGIALAPGQVPAFSPYGYAALFLALAIAGAIALRARGT